MAKRTNRRGVTLIEGLASSVILLIGMVGVLQGILIASLQNSMANRRTRASVIAAELAGALENEGRERLFASGGVLESAHCTATYPSALDDFRGDFTGVPSNLTGFSVCYVDLDALVAGGLFPRLTPAYSPNDQQVFSRLLAVYFNPSDAEITYVGINVGWREAASPRVVERFTALYSTQVNQTNLEF